jgi:hypothetical protein
MRKEGEAWRTFSRVARFPLPLRNCVLKRQQRAARHVRAVRVPACELDSADARAAPSAAAAGHALLEPARFGTGVAGGAKGVCEIDEGVPVAVRVH